MSDKPPAAAQPQWGAGSESSDTTARNPSPERGRDRHRSSSLTRQIHNIDDQDAEEAYAEQEEADNRGLGALHHIRSRTRSRPDQIVIGWEPDDAKNPYNWSDASHLPGFTHTLILHIT
ncbi:hypothetical protein K4F52_000445 [Lecanicillium sp. MT-2017a]|nr:hypothetical protein K4F52_000445 [Lecanicillium sp. MT-2017a]